MTQKNGLLSRWFFFFIRRCSRQGAGIGQSPMGDDKCFWHQMQFFFPARMIASILTDLAKVGRMTSCQNPMMLRSDEGSKLDDVSLFVHPKKKR